MTIGAFILLVLWKRCTCIPLHFVSCCPLMHLIVRMLPICHPFLLKGTLTTVNGWNRSKMQLLSSSAQPRFLVMILKLQKAQSVEKEMQSTVYAVHYSVRLFDQLKTSRI